MVIEMTATTWNLEMSRVEARHLEKTMNRTMKTALAAIVLLFAMTASVFAGPRTLFDSKYTTIGGFGGPTAAWTTFNGENAALLGGQGALLINSKYYVGLGGAGIVTEHNPNFFSLDEVNGRMEMGYGGLLVGAIINSDDVMHTAADVLVGGGSLVYSYRNFNSSAQHDDWYSDRDYEDDPFFMVQPMLHVELNMMKWWRVSLDGGYRFVTGVDKFNMSNEDLSGPVAGMTFRFGKF